MTWARNGIASCTICNRESSNGVLFLVIAFALGCSGKSDGQRSAGAGGASAEQGGLSQTDSAGGSAGIGQSNGGNGEQGQGGTSSLTSATGGSTTAATNTGAGGGGGVAIGAGGQTGGNGGQSQGGTSPLTSAAGGSTNTATNAGAAGSAGIGTGGQTTAAGLPIDPVVRGGFCAEKWCWSHPLPQGNNIHAMWSAAGAGVWAVGSAGVALHWNGASWERVAVPGWSSIPSVWGCSANDVYLYVGGFWHFDGQRLSKVTLPSAFDSLWFTDLSGTGPNDVWATTSNGVAHFDGTAWTIASGISSSTSMTRVRAEAPNAVWVAGQGLNLWNGQTWTKVSTTQPDALFSTGPDDIWYTYGGSVYRGGVNQPFTRSGTVAPTEGSRTLFGTAADDMYVLGFSGSLSHFDGQAWGSEAFTDQTVHGGYAWTGTAYERGQAWLGGSRGRLWRVTNGQLEALTAVVPSAAMRDLNSVWSDGSVVYAVGASFLKLDSSGASDQWQPVAGTESLFGFTGIWGSSPTDIWVCGTGARIWHFDGKTLTSVASGEPAGNPSGIGWNDIHGSGPNDIWAVGTKGHATHWDGQQWTTGVTSSVSSIDDVWVSPDGNAWAVGQSGIAMRFTPSLGGWTDIAEITFSSEQWTSVTGTSSNDVWVASTHNEIHHFNGANWSLVPGTGYASGSIQKLWALGPNDVWGAAGFGSIVHWNGSTWTRLDVRVDQSLMGIWMSPSGEGWAVGNLGTILHRVP